MFENQPRGHATSLGLRYPLAPPRPSADRALAAVAAASITAGIAYLALSRLPGLPLIPIGGRVALALAAGAAVGAALWSCQEGPAGPRAPRLRQVAPEPPG